MATVGEFYRSLYRVSKGPELEFWHPDSMLCKDQDQYKVLIWNACRTWEQKTCESMMKCLGKTPFIWGLRNQTRKFICSSLCVEETKEFVQNVPLPYLNGICPDNVERYELSILFKSMLEVSEIVFGYFQWSPKTPEEFERDLLNNYHWLFPHSTMALLIRNNLRIQAREKFRELTGEEYGDILPPGWSTDNSWIPPEKSHYFNLPQF